MPENPNHPRPQPPKPSIQAVGNEVLEATKWEFPKIRGTLFGVLIISILLFRVLY